MSSVGNKVTDDNIITRRKAIKNAIDEIRAKKVEIAAALKNLSQNADDEGNKEMMKQLIAAFDTMSVKEEQYMGILKTIISIHEAATEDVVKDIEQGIQRDKESLGMTSVEADGNEEDLDELKEIMIEFQKASEEARMASELNEKLVERFQLQKKKKNAMMEMRLKKSQQLDEAAENARNDVAEKLKKLSEMKKLNASRQKELNDLRKQCLALGIQVGANDHPVAVDAHEATVDDSRRVPVIESCKPKIEMTEEEKEKKREEIRKNIQKELEQKEKVNCLIREKLAAIEARKNRLREIRLMMERRAAAEMEKEEKRKEEAKKQTEEEEKQDGKEQNSEDGDCTVSEGNNQTQNGAEAKEENNDPAGTTQEEVDMVLETAKSNLELIVQMRQKLEDMKQKGENDGFSSDDVQFLDGFDQVTNMLSLDVMTGDFPAEDQMEMTVQNTFEKAIRHRPSDSVVISSRLASIESIVRRNQELLLNQKKVKATRTAKTNLLAISNNNNSNSNSSRSSSSRRNMKKRLLGATTTAAKKGGGLSRDDSAFWWLDGMCRSVLHIG